MHNLDFYIHPDINLKSFKVSDLSFYDENLTVKNGVLEITPPGFINPIIFRVNKDFEIVLNTNLLRLNTNNLKDTPNLPDGIYNIKYSIDPNLKVFIEYYYFRNHKQLNEFYRQLTHLETRKRDYSSKDYYMIQKELLWIKELISGAKYMAEDKHDIVKAHQMYEEVFTLLKVLNIC